MVFDLIDKRTDNKPISQVFNCDCLEFMKSLPDKYFELAITDPPYGIDLANMNMGIGKSKKSSKLKNRKWISKDWDKSVPNEDYFNELFRISKHQVIWGGNYFSLFPCSHYVVWDKEVPEGLSFADCEMAWTSFSKAPRMYRLSAYLDKKNKIHPTQKPVALYKWLLQNYAKQGDKIFDSHMGSQSSRIAAYDMGFDYCGCELDKDYFEQGCERYNTHIKQTTLFDREQAYNVQPKQTGLF